jgi:putative ABC transport system permease protein
MIKHYFRIAWRNLLKNKVFSAINVVGLAVGLTCCLFMTLYIKHELSYDNFQPNGNRIARVIMEYSFSGKVNKGNYTSTKVAPSFTRNFPEVEAAVRMFLATRVVKHEEKLFTEKKFMYADSTFFKAFSHQFVTGSSKAALNGPNKVVLTESAANKYFDNEDPVGKILKIGSSGVDYEVTGVMKDYPSNSQMRFDFLASFSSLGVIQETTYWDANYTTYFLLKDEGSIASLQAKIPSFMKKEMGIDVNGNDYVTFWLEPLKTVHLYSEYQGFEPNNSITYVYIVGAVALLMLLIACFTYINLSTARSIERAKEVGVRKVVGAFKKQIFWQFISESFILSFCALLLSILTVMLLLPFFNQLTDKELTVSSLYSLVIAGFAMLVILSISLLAGSYPALILSRFQPVKVLKGAFKNSSSGLTLRRSLIVFQFVISVFLIISTFIIRNQLNYLQTKNLGYDREHVIVLPADSKIQEKIATIKSVFKSNPNVLHVSRVAHNPTNIQGGYNMRRDDMPEETQIMVTANPVDEEFVKTTGLRILAGSDFTEQDMKDVMKDKQEEKTYHYVLNEAAAKELGWTPQEAIGKKMFLGNHRPGYVRAVVNDFHFTSLHTPIKSLVLFNEQWMTNMLVKVSGKDMEGTLAFLQSKWKEVVPFRPFEYNFLDENYDKLYSSELRLGKVLTIFAAIAILLACLGLFGLSAFVIQQRTKEIGIRKVLGASVSNVVTLLSKDFVGLVILSMLIAFPLGAWLMHKWLQDFAYRINISWWMFAVAGVLALLITLITISFQAIRAALSNPVKSLRTE